MSILIQLLPVFGLALLFAFLRARDKRLPPGPPAGFLGDNRTQIEPTAPHISYFQWIKQYGPIISFRLGRNPIVVLGSAKVAWDLLEKRGDIYSDRPRSIMAQEILANNLRSIGMSWGERLRKYDKLQHLGLSGKAAQLYCRFQSLESAVLIRDLLQNPDGYVAHFNRYATSVAFCSGYGRRIKSMEEPVVLANRLAMRSFGKTQVPGRYLVESWPILLWIPKPLQWFRWEMEAAQKRDEALYLSCLREVKKRVEEGTAQESMCSRILEVEDKFGLSEAEIAYCASAPYTAGISTVTASFEVFLLAMLLHPECAKKAQIEMDEVVGRARMPNFEDAANLPYLDALIKEATRWRVIAPTGVPHAVARDDEYAGYFIPKGTAVYANIFAMSQDEELFPEPDKFKPERFLDNNDPRFREFILPFGFGRRVCPGMHVAHQSMFIVFSRMLWSFDILPALDETGKAILPSPDAFVGVLVRQPLPFKCRLKARGSETEDIITSFAAESEEQLKAWE